MQIHRHPLSKILKTVGAVALSAAALGAAFGAVVGAAVGAVLGEIIREIEHPSDARLKAFGDAPLFALLIDDGSSPLTRGSPARQTTANFGSVEPSKDARAVADWIARMNDSQGQMFVVIDKKSAHLYLFNAEAELQAHSPVLLGSALGDDSVPGIGDKPIDQVKPHERTTPAGRFVGEPGRNARGEDVVWVDYDAAVSMHRVVTSNAAERRLERLASPSTDDNRISYGCINVPTAFYDLHIRPAFSTHTTLVYVLPDKAPLNRFFGM